MAAYLMQRDLSRFNPGAVPRQTAAFFEIVHASQAPEEAALADALDELERPPVITLAMLLATPCAAAMPWLESSPRLIPLRLERCGYAVHHNLNAEDGLWRINKRRQMIYVKAGLTKDGRSKAAWNLMAKMKKEASDET